MKWKARTRAPRARQEMASAIPEERRYPFSEAHSNTQRRRGSANFWQQSSLSLSSSLPSPVKQPDCRSRWERERERMEGGLDFLPPSLSPSRDMRPSAAKNGVYKFATVVGPFLPFRRLPRPSD